MNFDWKVGVIIILAVAMVLTEYFHTTAGIAQTEVAVSAFENATKIVKVALESIEYAE